MKGRKHKSTGGVNEAEEDLKTKPEARTNAKEIDREAEEMEGKKRGGRAKKHAGKVAGESKHHAGRKARKSGGRASDNPFAFAAHHGTSAKGRNLEPN
jgi:hypothetical protein